MVNFIEMLEHFTFTDAIDIFVLSIILYRFFVIIQGTRAVQILVGTALVTTLYWLSLTYELYSLTWLLKNFFDYFFVILIILFQEQIKTALALFGQGSLFGRNKKYYMDAQIEEVVTACSVLSREKNGALIVFEKFHGLLNYASTGTTMDSQIHSDILYALFQSSSPLHDGAVILSHNKITSAGCFLPLSKNIELDRNYGTRHRAALGISEVSDAFVVIVSEETGKITTCSSGVFTICKNELELRAQLRRNLFSPSKTNDVVIGSGRTV